jgi:hypothetical protein
MATGAHKAPSRRPNDEARPNGIEPMLIQRHACRLHREQLPLPIELNVDGRVRDGK